MNRFDYVKYDELHVKSQNLLKEMYTSVAAAIESGLPSGRAKDIALNRLEESYMWVGKCLRDHQLKQDMNPTY